MVESWAMIGRPAEIRRIRQGLRRSRVVALVGPRQCGKTTLARSLGRAYFNLEDPDERTRLDATWATATVADGLTVFDEAQFWPELFRRLRGVIDADRKRNGRFLLLGSVAPTLMRDAGESLAGRMATLELTPFHQGEVGDPERKMVDVRVDEDPSPAIYERVKQALTRLGFSVQPYSNAMDRTLAIEIRTLELQSVKRPLTFRCFRMVTAWSTTWSK